MIFIVFFGLIAVVIIALNLVDSNNINKIEKYLKSKKCEIISYNSGQYKGACKDSIIVINNAFSIDTSKPDKVIFYKEIKDIKREDKKLIVLIKENRVDLNFKDQNSANEFYKKVQNKL